MTGTGFFPLGREEAYAITADELFLVGHERGAARQHALRRRRSTRRALPHQVRGHLARASAARRARTARTRAASTACTSSRRSSRWSSARPTRRSPRSIHYELLGNAEAILAKLEIPYRVALACTGEIGLGQTRKHEIESWMPGRNAYSETHSCSTLGDFQARRSNIRVRLADGSLVLPVHAEQHRHREPAHPHPAPREPPERRRLGHPAEGARPLHEREDRPRAGVTLRGSGLRAGEEAGEERNLPIARPKAGCAG